MMRLDKFLVEMEIGSRSQVKEYIKKGLVTVNNTLCKNADQKIDETMDIVAFKGTELVYSKFRYYMFHKPQGVVTATQDNHDKTVMDLLPSDIRKKDLFPVGRLDKDTEGLLLITDDGELAHMLLSPKRHVDKTYLVQLSTPISEEDMNRLETGVDIGEEKMTLPAKVSRLDDTYILLTIHEGKFHQVKRMLKAVDNEVVYLKRTTFGSLSLDEHLSKGAYRELTAEEVSMLKEEAGL